MSCLRFFYCFAFLLSPFGGYSLNNQTLQDWLHKLENTGGKQAILFFEVYDSINKMDSSESSLSIQQLKQAAAGQTQKVLAKLKAIEAAIMIDLQPVKKHPYYFQLINEALSTAHQTEDKILIADICYWYAEMLWKVQKHEQAAFYSLKAIEMQEALGIEKFPRAIRAYKMAGDVLYNTGNYVQALTFDKKVIALEKKELPSGDIVSLYNTIALCYQKLSLYDSAYVWYQKALLRAKEVKDIQWISIVTGNMGEMYFLQKKYDKAKPLLEYDYRTSLQKNMIVNAANSMQWAAQIFLYKQQLDSAVFLAKEALRLVQSEKEVKSIYYRNVYQTLAMAYKAKNIADSAWKYQQLYHKEADSVTYNEARSKADILQTKINYELSLSNINALLKEKQAEQVKRNFLLTGIIIVLFAAFLLYQNQRLRFRLKKEQLLQETAAAKQQLQSFTQNVIEKNEMIEQLQLQVERHTHQTTAELLQQTILTDEDWNRFQQLFKKVHPGFCDSLKKMAPDITQAELRLAALIKLNIPNKQIASIQGISGDSIRKSKHRLRQRLNIKVEDGLEEYITGI